MSSALYKARGKAALWLVVGALASVGLAGAATWWNSRAGGEGRLSGKVLPDFASQTDRIAKVDLRTTEGAYSLVKSAQGWVMPARGNYKVKDDAMNRLAKGLTELSYRAARTSDPSQFDRLGVGDPATGGDGALLSVSAASGPPLASLYVGVRGQSVYVRKPGTNSVYLADGDMPPLRDPAQWLDLAVLDIVPERIASVTGQKAGEEPYNIVRRPDGGLGPFGGVPNVNATTAALALTKWRPTDVAAASTITATPVATHATTLRNGLVIEAIAIEADGRGWLKLSARADTPEGQAEAQKLNAKLVGWAFALSPTDFADYTFSRDVVMGDPVTSP